MSLEIGQLIDGKYRISRLIGEGGMGAVYEGENIRINRRVAIKVLHAAFTGNKEVMQRFEREAQAAGRIGNDHILEVLDLGSLSDGDHFLVMEFLDGEPLGERIKAKQCLAPLELTPIVRQVLVGLAAAHAAGIVHRDLKPDNIYILKQKAGKSDFVKIIDFGISKFQPLAGDGMKMTRTGAVMGTPYYMSPEQASGSQEADHRSDLYSMGVIMFEALTGRVPFDAATFNQLMFKIVLAEVPTVESLRPDMDAAFSSIVAKAMARDINERFQSAAEFIQALDDWMAHGAAVRRPPADAVAAGFIPAGARAAMVSASRLDPTPAPGARTAGNWATSQPDSSPQAVPLKRSGPLIAAAAAIGLLLVAGGAFAVLKTLGKGESSTEATAAQPASSPPAAPAPAPPPPVRPDVKPESPTQVAEAPSANVPVSSAVAPSRAPRSPARQSRPLAAQPRPEVAKPATAKPAMAKPKSTSAPDFGY